jgi:hypothetical protein
MLKRLVRAIARRTYNWLMADGQGVDLANAVTLYPWLNGMHRKILADPGCAPKPQYAWGVLNAASLAKHLQIPRISVAEFGVAGGNGLVALERIAAVCESLVGVKIDVYGFDSAVGLPKPVDYRDTPNLFSENDFPMDVDKLRAKLERARLVLGPIQDTLPEFMRSDVAPFGFIAFDVDLYSSTVQALKTLEGPHSFLLPRVFCYFDDNQGLTYSEFTGERLAISEFNQKWTHRKISPIFGHRYFLNPETANQKWVEQIYLAHFFDHELYNMRDGLIRTSRMDLNIAERARMTLG